MSSTNKIRSGLIDKILSIKNRDFLEALDQLVSTSSSESEIVELSNEQKTMLEMSEKDIKQSPRPIKVITPAASPLTPSIKFIEFETPADAKAVKHIATKGSVRTGFKIVKSTSSNHSPVK